MTKQTTTILGVGALAIVGYLVYKQMSKNKPASFANFTSKAPLTRCGKSPHERVVGVTTDGRQLYMCCANGVLAYAPSKIRCGAATSGASSTLSDSTSIGGGMMMTDSTAGRR